MSIRTGLNSLCVALMLSVLLATPLKAVELVNKGKAVAQIVVAPDALPQVKFAARELQLHVMKMSGAELAIVSEPSDDAMNKVYVGESRFTRALGYAADDLAREEFRIVTGDRHVILLGGDHLNPKYPVGYESRYDGPAKLKEWQEYAGQKWGFPLKALYDPRYFNKEMGFSLFDASGTLFAVYELLEQQGVRWYMPGELGTIIPARQTIEVTKQDVRTQALFQRRFMRFSFPSSDIEGFKWSKRQRLGMAELAWIGHGTPYVTEYAQDIHPEYFAVIGGQMAMRRRGPLPRLAEPLVDAMAAYCKTLFGRYPHLRIASVGPADALTSIDDRDVAAGLLHEERGNSGRMSDYVWRYINMVAGKVKQSNPDKIIMGLAYSYYRDVPQNIGSMHDNVGVTFCQNRTWIPTAEALHELASERDKWISKLPSGEFYTWEYYLHHAPGKQTYGIPAIFTRIMQEDAQLLNGKSKGEYVECSWEPGGMALPALNHFMYYLQARLYWNVDLDRQALMDEYCSLFFGPAAADMKEFFAFAEEVWTRPLARHITLTGGFLRTDDVKHYFVILEKARAKVENDSDYAKRIDQFIKECEPMKKIHTALKRQGPDFIAAKATISPVIDGDLNEPAWQDSPAANVVAYPMRDLYTEEIKDPATQVKLRWAADNSGLYVGITCFEPDMANLRPQIKENDSLSIFDNDVVEVFLETQTRSTFHLAININGAIYDACSDAQMTPSGINWNLNGKVANKREADRWTTELFIPMASLGQEATIPTKDQPWGINVGRTRFHENKPQNSAISPSQGGFKNISRFGDLIAR